MKKRHFFFEWLGILVVGTLVFTAAAVWLETLTHKPEPGVDFEPWRDLPGMYLLAPIGWGIVGLIGPLWVVLFGLIAVRKTKRRIWHLLTLAGTILFGFLWPPNFWMWMSA